MRTDRSRLNGLRRLARFCTVGASGVCINLAVLWIAREHVLLQVRPAVVRLNVSLAIAIAVSTLSNFCWNRYWTWRDRGGSELVPHVVVQFGQYVLSVAAGTALQVLLTNLLASRVHYLAANGLSILAGAVANFAVNDAWTFRARAAR